MHLTTLLLSLSSLASTQVLSYPWMNLPGAAEHYISESNAKRVQEKRQFSFSASAQAISTTGQHKFVPPGSGDLRGPCPGLNALANHGYLPHDGYVTLEQAVQATNQVFGMGVDLGTFLSAYATVIDGDPVGLQWSIGGARSGLTNLGGLLGTPQGLSGSHNKYESDASPTRFDSFLNNGDSSSLSLAHFQQLYARQAGDSGGDYNLDVLIDHARDRIRDSRANNPRHFWGPFTGPVVSSAAFTFIPAFMSNHSAERPEGFLDQTVLKSFFAVSGTQGKLTHNRGNERIPDNWYRRPFGSEYTIPAFALEAVQLQLAVPERLSVGGNTGTPGSFVGIGLDDLTGGVFKADTLLQGNNLICLGYETILTAVPDVLKGILGDVSSALNVITSQIAPQFAQFNCPQLNYYNKDLFNQFPGAGSGL